MNTTENGKARYYAFISHKSTDAKFALKLQKFIESYKLSDAICRMAGLRNRQLTPLCSYEVDFSSSPLMDEMRSKLTRSDYLILLCSEELLKSDPRYVNYEIRTFIECKKAEVIDPLTRIIPIIVTGEFGSEEHECCPEALRELGENCPIALDRKKYKNDRELFLHIISSLLNIDYAVIENRDKKRQRKQKLIWGTVLSLLLATGILLGEYFIPQESHYVDFVMRNGLPEGIGPLAAEDWQQMKGHYVITRQKHKIQSLEYVNAYGNRIDHDGNVYDGDRPSAYLFSYTDEGLSAVTYENRLGDPYFILQYSGSSMTSADLRNPYASDDAFYIGLGYESDPSMLLADVNIASHSDISRFRYEYSPEGYVTKVFFCFDSTGRLAQDNSVYGFEYVLDEKGRITETYFLDAQGQRRLNSEGLYCRKFTYDDRDDLVLWVNYDINGNPMANTEGITRCIFSYDEHHNLRSYSFLDETDAPVFVSSYGGAGQNQYVDDQGNLLLVELIGEDGTPSTEIEYCAMAFTYDSNGYVTSRTYQDQSGQAVMDAATNYAEIRYQNDENGNQTQRSYHDDKGNLQNNAYGFARETIEYNDMGKEITHTYFDSDGNPADYRGYGYSSVETTYDEQCRETALCYFGPDGEPVNILGPIFAFAYHKVETIYEYGSHTKQTVIYYDADGNPVNMQSSLGEEYSRVELYVQNGEITYLAAYRADGSVFGNIMESETTRSAQAEPITTYRYTDENGNVLKELVKQYQLNGVDKKSETTVFDDQGNPTSVMVSLYHDNGQKKSDTSTEYGSDGSITCEYVREYDQQGKVIKETLSDPASPDAYIYTVFSNYDDTGTLTEEQHTTLRDDGSTASFSSQTFHPDGTRDTTDTTYYDRNGEILTRSVTAYADGVRVSTKEYDYDEQGILSMVLTTRYHSDGSVAVREYLAYQENGLPDVSSEFRYNPDGTTTQTTVFYDEQGNAASSVQRRLDDENNEIG